MADILISEFMDEDVITRDFAGRDVLYDPKLVDKPEQLVAALADARALVVRNRTQVRPALLAAAPRLRVVGRLGVILLGGAWCGGGGEGPVVPVAVHRGTGFVQADDIGVADRTAGCLPVHLALEVVGGGTTVHVHH